MIPQQSSGVSTRFHVSVITGADDLGPLVRDINAAGWDAANDMSAYDVSALAAYLARQDTIFLACYGRVDARQILFGIASGRLEFKPYGGQPWLYVDEVDVRADRRRSGAGRAMMQRFLAIAQEFECEEVWLGTERDNDAANALYRAPNPDDEADVVGYTFGRGSVSSA